MKEFFLNLLNFCWEWFINKYDIFLHWLYKFTYGIPCDTFEQEIASMMMWLGWVLFITAIYFFIRTIVDYREEYINYSKQYEFYLFRDEVIRHKRWIITKCIAAEMMIVCVSLILGSMLMIMPLPVESREGTYAYWRWVHDIMYGI